MEYCDRGVGRHSGTRDLLANDTHLTVSSLTACGCPSTQDFDIKSIEPAENLLNWAKVDVHVHLSDRVPGPCSVASLTPFNSAAASHLNI